MVQQDQNNNDAAEFQKWRQRIADYDKEFKSWQTRTKKIIDRYRDKRSESESFSKFNILWSNVQTLIPAVYARLPEPNVSRRFRDNDPIGRVASLLIERSLSYELDHYSDYRSAMELCVTDRFLGGRATAWVRYEPHFKALEEGMPEDGFQLTEDIENDEGAESEGMPAEEIEYECSPVDYVYWRDFGHVVAKTWEEVPGIWRRVYLGRQALVERFGEDLGNKIPMDARQDADERMTTDKNAESETACIYEIWCKESKEALWLSMSMGKIIDRRQDPLGLDGFWPCPRPLFATLTSDSLIPTPDFSLYQDQARQLDRLSQRVDDLLNALKVRGTYNGEFDELRTLFADSDNNDLVPIKDYMAFAEKGGMRGALELVDLTPIVAALAECYNSMQNLKQQVFEIAGIPDIMRGASEENETATAQRIKGNFGSLRLKAMQGKVVQFATELLQIKAQIICKFYQPETLLKMAGADQFTVEDQQMIPQAIQLLKDGDARDWRIEISTDSMVQLDESQEKADRVEFLNSVSAFMQKVVPAAQSTPELAPLLVSLLKFGVTGFKVGKSIEGEFDAALDKLKEAASNPQQKPNPELEKAQAQAQASMQETQAKLSAEAQLEQMRLQFQQQKFVAQQQAAERQAQLDAQVEAHKQEMQARQNQHQNELEAQRESQRAQNEMMLEQMRIEREEASRERDRQFNLLLEEMRSAAKVEVAEIGANTTLQIEQQRSADNAANSMSGDYSNDSET